MRRIRAIVLTDPCGDSKKVVYLISVSTKAAITSLEDQFGIGRVYSAEEGDSVDSDPYWNNLANGATELCCA